MLDEDIAKYKPYLLSGIQNGLRRCNFKPSKDTMHDIIQNAWLRILKTECKRPKEMPIEKWIKSSSFFATRTYIRGLYRNSNEKLYENESSYQLNNNDTVLSMEMSNYRHLFNNLKCKPNESTKKKYKTLIELLSAGYNQKDASIILGVSEPFITEMVKNINKAIKTIEDYYDYE